MASAAEATTNQAGTNKKPTTVKPSLKDPERIDMIRTHRALQFTTFGGARYVSTICLSHSTSEDPKLEFSEKVSKHLKPIKLRQIDTEQEWVYTKSVLYLTLIEDPMTRFTPIHTIGEDEDGNTTRLFIHEIPHNNQMLDLLCYGRQLAIMSPYLRIALDGKHGIRVDDPSTVVLLGKKKNMCRYCGTENAPHKCARCKTAPYCSRNCQTFDWKDLNHRRICKKLTNEI